MSEAEHRAELPRTPRAQGAGHEAGGIQRGQDPSAPAKWDGGDGRYGKWGVYISITYNQIYICTSIRVTDGTGSAMVVKVLTSDVTDGNGCHKALVVMEQWMSQSNGCYKATDVTKQPAVTEQWVSQSSGCHKAMAVTEQWMSQRFGGKSRTKASFFTSSTFTF